MLNTISTMLSIALKVVLIFVSLLAGGIIDFIDIDDLI